MPSDPRAWIAALRGSHDRLAGLVRPLTPEQIRAQSFCTDWSIAQVLSHVGSGAEISLLMLPGALGEGELAGPEAFQPVWDVWNAKTPDEQAADALVSDERQVEAMEQLTDEQLSKISLPFFGMDLDAVGLVRLRLGRVGTGHALNPPAIGVVQREARAGRLDDPVGHVLRLHVVRIFFDDRVHCVPREIVRQRNHHFLLRIRRRLRDGRIEASNREQRSNQAWYRTSHANPRPLFGPLATA